MSSENPSSPEEEVARLLRLLGAPSDETPEGLLYRFMETDGKGFTAIELLPIVILLRNLGRLPLRSSFFQIAKFASHIAERRVQKVYSERYSAQFRQIEKTHGLEENEEFEEGSAPAEHRALWEKFEQEERRIHASLLREYGECAMASLYLDDPEEFDRLYERGRREMHGPLPQKRQDEE